MQKDIIYQNLTIFSNKDLNKFNLKQQLPQDPIISAKNLLIH